MMATNNEKQGAAKPHIERNPHLNGWMCGPRGWSYIGLGFGDSPKAAFADWAAHVERMQSKLS